MCPETCSDPSSMVAESGPLVRRANPDSGMGHPPAGSVAYRIAVVQATHEARFAYSA
jgi:hypothetical protein